MGYQIAIDGPSGSGKSTLAKGIAKKLGVKYVDTGAMYRAVGYYMAKNSVNLSNSNDIADNMDGICLEASYAGDVFCIILNGEDITEKLRTQEVADYASKVAVVPVVRERLVKLQQDIAKKYDVVMEGRDIGYRVLKDADLKIFLDASPHVRTLRRVSELNKKNIPCGYETIRAEIEERDYRDYNRGPDPLAQSEGSVYIDSSGMTEEEVIGCIIGLTGRGVPKG
ncbi:MAG: (d)CMP kinase [Clostridiales bacterium]|nr:(d)CMP kinase [Clostridiales bacterium]